MNVAQSKRSPEGRTGSAGASKPLPPQGASLLVLAATLIVGVGAFVVLLRVRAPEPGWLLLLGTLAAAYAELRLLPGLKERRALRDARQEGKRLLKAVKHSMRKQRDWTGSTTREKIEAAQARLQEVLPSADLDAIQAATKTLDDLAEKAFTRKSLKREYTEQIGAALLAALFLRAFFYEAYKIPSPSMLPTLDVGDHLFVNKFVYGIRIPFTLTKIFTQVPKRGDIVVFDKPEPPPNMMPRRGRSADDSGDAIIKRVIGLPGDTIVVKDRHITINGKPLETRDLPIERLNYNGDRKTVTDTGPCWGDPNADPCPDKSSTFMLMRPFEETVGTHHHVALEILNRGYSDQSPPKEGTFVVQPGHVFVMGDDRDDSEDSRFGFADGGFGQVPLNYIRGRADIIWLSLGGPRGVRFDRFFKLLH